MEHEHTDLPEASSAATTTEQPDTAGEQPDAAGEQAELKQQRDDYYDRLLRKTAEFDNYRKRTERERIQLSEAAAADLLTELLPLVDDLERALQADVLADAPAKAG